LLLDPWGAKFNRPYPEDYEVKFLTDVLREHFERNHIHNPTVMAFEVGNLAWGLEAKVYDILGLTAPDVVRFGGKKNPLYILEKYKPDYAVIVDLASYEPTATILESFEFNKDYSLMFSKRRALGDYYNVYERQPDKHLKKAWSVSDFGSPSYMSPGFSATTMKHAWRIDGHGPDPYAIYNVPAAVTQDCSLMCIDAASSEEGIMRVRWNVKANEPNERLQDLLVTGRGRQDLCISLPTNTRLENFRLDPIEGLQSIKLHEVDLYGEDCAKS
jgi:hypothetical protein